MTSIDKIKSQLEQFAIDSLDTLEQFRLQFLTKKSELQELLSEIKNVAPEERKSFGQQVNELKQKAQQLYEEAKAKMEFQAEQAGSDLDVTRPSTANSLGSMHPISIMMNEVCDIFEKIGFSTVSGPDVEDDWHVFTALNFPEEHPARDMQDTFFIELHPDVLLRTHTSSL